MCVLAFLIDKSSVCSSLATVDLTLRCPGIDVSVIADATSIVMTANQVLATTEHCRSGYQTMYNPRIALHRSTRDCEIKEFLRRVGQHFGTDTIWASSRLQVLRISTFRLQRLYVPQQHMVVCFSKCPLLPEYIMNRLHHAGAYCRMQAHPPARTIQTHVPSMCWRKIDRDSKGLQVILS